MVKYEDANRFFFSQDNYGLINIQCLIANFFDKVDIADVIYESYKFIHVNFVQFILNSPKTLRMNQTNFVSSYTLLTN